MSKLISIQMNPLMMISGPTSTSSDPSRPSHIWSAETQVRKTEDDFRIIIHLIEDGKIIWWWWQQWQWGCSSGWLLPPGLLYSTSLNLGLGLDVLSCQTPVLTRSSWYLLGGSFQLLEYKWHGGRGRLIKAWRPLSKRRQWSVHCLGDTCGNRFD